MHLKSKTKHSGNGKRKIKFCDKKECQRGNYFISTKFGNADVKVDYRTKGGNHISKLKKALYVNLLTKEGYKKVKMIAVLDSKDINRNFARLNIVTRGTIINTEAGKAKIVNRPGREGAINAVLMEE